MTSNTAPWGEASASNYSSSVEPYKAFDSDDKTLWISKSAGPIEWIQYKFNEKVIVKHAKIATNNNRVTKFNIQGSNDGTQWTTILEDTNLSTSAIVNITNNTGFQYYRLNCLKNSSNGKFNTGISTLQFYGLDYSEREFAEGSTMKYLYDHGVELEQINGFSTNSSSAFYTKESNQLYVNKTVNNSISLFNTSNGIDISPYKLLRGIAGDKFAYAGGNVDISIRPAHNDTSQTISQNNLSSNFNELPNNIFLDVSSINSVAYPVMSTNDGGTVNSMSLKEWWLE